MIMNRTVIFLALIALTSCVRNEGSGNEMKCEPVEPSSSQDSCRLENSRKLLNEDSTYIDETAIIVSKETTLEDKQIAILLNVASHLIKEEQDAIRKSDGLNCSIPVVVEISQMDDFNGNNTYMIYWSNMGVREAPTRIERMRDRYVLLYLEGEKPLSENELPKILLDEDCTDEYVVLVINELSWAVSMCKNSTKHIVVKNVLSEAELSTCFGAFSCE